MHEYSIAYDIYLASKKAAMENKASRINKIHVDMGEMVIANPEQVRFLFDVIVEEEELFDGAELVFTSIDPLARCGCGYQGHEIFSCPRCGGVPEVLKGREIIVTRMEIEVAEE
ncbi:MAG: hydrogenase maturation nickel metallochaperone HypA [Methanomicrobiales archaeon]|nr:hydrogenase maturation nickel metallochaperone HypA [Methanomicrobiales archaeon]